MIYLWKMMWKRIWTWEKHDEMDLVSFWFGVVFIMDMHACCGCKGCWFARREWMVGQQERVWKGKGWGKKGKKRKEKNRGKVVWGKWASFCFFCDYVFHTILSLHFIHHAITLFLRSHTHTTPHHHTHTPVCCPLSLCVDHLCTHSTLNQTNHNTTKSDDIAHTVVYYQAWVRWLLCNDINTKAIPLSQQIAQCPHLAKHANTIKLIELARIHRLWYTCDCPSRTRDGCMGCHWQLLMKHPITLTSTPSTNKNPPSLHLSFNPHSTHPALRQYHDSPHLSLWRLCGWHAVSWHTDRNTHICERKSDHSTVEHLIVQLIMAGVILYTIIEKMMSKQMKDWNHLVLHLCFVEPNKEPITIG